MNYTQLPPEKQKLLRRSRRNLIKCGSAIPSEWKVGNEHLTGVECMFRDIGVRPTASHSLNRKDNTQPHSKENSFWAVAGAKDNRTINWMNRTWKLRELADISGFPASYICGRLDKMTISQAILTPKSSRTFYPIATADRFFLGLDFTQSLAMIKEKVIAERNDFKQGYGLRSRNLSTDVSRANKLLGMPIVNRVMELLELTTLTMQEKSRLFAFFACPSDVKNRTRHVLDGIKTRCRNDESGSYNHYGGRGIHVCERWVSGDGELSNLECFVLDVGPWQPGLELDRVDNDGNYEPGNCRWVTRSENIRNTFRSEDIASRLNALVRLGIDEIIRNTSIYESLDDYELTQAIADL